MKESCFENFSAFLVLCNELRAKQFVQLKSSEII